MGIDYKEYKKDYLKVKVDCPCGVSVCRSNFNHHKKSDRHKFYIEKHCGGFISDPEEYDKQKIFLSARKGF